LDIVHVPYKSGAPALTGLMTGEIDMYFGNASELLQQASSDRIKLLAVSSRERLEQKPDIPTIGELYPGFRITSWNGFLAPSGIPRTIVDKIAQETGDAARDPAIAARLLGLGIAPSGAGPEDFAQVIRDENVLYRDAIKAAGVKPE
jgi:tripartite-type tricarboxylate transporter receptor subunit TctC